MPLADHIGLGPTRRVVSRENGIVVLEVTAPAFMGNLKPQYVNLKEAEYKVFLRCIAGQISLQFALPRLSACEREILMSGICPENRKDDDNG
jgi:hypothetical protein